MSQLKREDLLSINHEGRDQVACLFYGGRALPKYGPWVAVDAGYIYCESIHRSSIDLGVDLLVPAYVYLYTAWQAEATE
jgi:hypothetical protein